MTYYILLDMDTTEDIWDENILGEESFGTFYTGNGFKAFQNMVIREPQILETIAIDSNTSGFLIIIFLNAL